MKNKSLLSLGFLMLFLFSMARINAQNTVIITEYRGDEMQQSYIELTNVGEDTVDLSRYTLGALHIGRATATWDENDSIIITNLPGHHVKRLEGKLGPDESYVAMNVSDLVTEEGTINHKKQLVKRSDLHVHLKDGALSYPMSMPEYEVYPFDSIDNDYHNLVRAFGGQMGKALWYHYSEDDSMVVDLVNANWNKNATPITQFRSADNVAGVNNATLTHILIRKADIQKGNLEWEQSKGIGPEDSEWLVIPHGGLNIGGEIFGTAGIHGDYGIDISSETIDIDEQNNKLTVPWGIYKGDSIIDEFSLGPNMAWEYHYDPTSFEDSLSTLVRDGDSLTLFAFGNDRDEKKYGIEVKEPADDMAQVFPRHQIQYIDEEGEPITPVPGAVPYFVTDEDPEIDSILDVGYGTRVDTLLKYLEKAPDADWEIDWVDDQERVDVKYGDKLVVTAADGQTTKEYFIKVDEYEPSHNASLAAITWPDKPGFIFGWDGDTIPSFRPDVNIYTVELPYGTEKVPALNALPHDVNAHIDIDRATALDGSFDARTTEINVAAEDDTTIVTYKVSFNVQKDPGKVQKYEGEPFFSEVSMNLWANFCYLEIANPGNVAMDLSQYIIVAAEGDDFIDQGIANWTAADEASFNSRYRKYIPGYKYTTLEDWTASPGRVEIDPQVDPLVDPGDVFSMGLIRRPGASDSRAIAMMEKVDQESDIMFNNEYHTFDVPLVNNAAHAVAQVYKNRTYVIMKILNDTILDGDKGIYDPADFEVVDIFGEPEPTVMGGREIDFWMDWVFWRKADVYKGNPELGHPDPADSSEWVVGFAEDPEWDRQEMINNYGAHVMDPVTVYLSTISSKAYKVSDGYKGIQTIQGEFTDSTVQDLYDNLDKGDENQYMKVISGDDGSEKGLNDPVAGDDTLFVTSADSLNTTKYAMINQPLDDDKTLTAVDGSGMTVNLDQATVTGLEYGDLVNDVMSNLTVPATATKYLVNEDSVLVPQKLLDSDTNYVDVLVHDGLYVEVRAENASVKWYELVMDSEASDAYVTSSLYEVNQELQLISGFPGGVSVSTFLGNIHPVSGAVVNIVDKAGFVREQGVMAFDDKAMVTSEDGSNSRLYNLKFYAEPEGTEAYVISKVPEIEVLPLDRIIQNIPAEQQISLFLAALSPAEMATMQVIDTNGNPVESGMVMEDYQLKVTSGNGQNIAMYDLSLEDQLSSVAKVTGPYSINDVANSISDVPRETSVSDFLNALNPEENATMKLIDVDGNEKTSGEVVETDRLVVTAENGENTRTYIIRLAAAEELFAYVTSSEYTINETSKVIRDVPGDTPVSDFIDNLTPAPQATIKLIDIDGNEVDTGMVKGTQKLIVTSGDSAKTATYSIFLTVSIINIADINVSVYPNPATEVIYLENVPQDSRIKVCNLLGESVMTQQVNQNIESINVNNLSSGMYILVIQNKGVNEAIRFIKE